MPQNSVGRPGSAAPQVPGVEPVLRPTRATAAGDHQLMARMQRGSVHAFGELYDRYRDRAYTVARSVLPDNARAEDAVQEGFVSIWNSRASYRPESPTAAAWLLTVVRHRAIDMRRRTATHEGRLASAGALETRPAGDDVAGEALRRSEARELRRMLTRLPDAQREVIALAFFGQLTSTEIAEQLRLPVGTVKGRMRLGLHKLRREIDPIAA